MNTYPEIKKIAGLNAKINRLAEIIENKIDCEGVEWRDARLISGCREKNGHLYHDNARLDNSGLVDDDYYCSQHTGYCEDCYYGTLYFKTNVPGQFVAVHFEM